MEPWLREKLSLISQKTKLAEAIRYALSHWQGLSLFLDDGCVEIGSNTVERSIRPLALTRKNVLFAGSDGGAEHWAVIASLVETAKLNGVEPHAYLVGIITRIVSGHPNSRIDELLPWAYPAHAAFRDVASGRRLPFTKLKAMLGARAERAIRAHVTPSAQSSSCSPRPKAPTPL
jgi:hypothetical protein